MVQIPAKKSILFLVCPNGLGHFRRVLSIVEDLLRVPDLDIQIVCSKNQFQKKHFWDFEAGHKPHLVKWHIRQFPEETTWQKHPSVYQFSNYQRWIKNLENEDIFQKVDLVISDNLVGILAARSDAWLMGSFLWFDILETAFPTETEIKAIVKEEQKLLQKCQPPMLCVQDAAMPTLNKWVKPQKLPWFTDRIEAKESSTFNNFKSKILITGGNTESIFKTLITLVDLLQDTSNLNIYLDGKLFQHFNKADNNSITPFSFSEKDFRQLSLVVCRPGIGILTDCVKYGTPVLALWEKNNKEMNYNARLVRNLGIGKTIDKADVLELSQTINEMLEVKNSNLYRQNLLKLQTGGTKAAANIILNHLNLQEIV